MVTRSLGHYQRHQLGNIMLLLIQLLGMTSLMSISLMHDGLKPMLQVLSDLTSGWTIKTLTRVILGQSWTDVPYLTA